LPAWVVGADMRIGRNVLHSHQLF